MRARTFPSTPSVLFAFPLLWLLLGGCDDSPGIVLTPDAGAPDAGPGDAGDVVGPHVVSTSPDNGALGVSPAVEIEIVFSEPMAAEDDLAVTVDGADVALGAVSWDEDAQTLRVSPSAPFSPGARVTITVGEGFTDEAGNALPLPYELTFSVADAVAPTVVSSTPEDGATDVSRRIAAVEIELSEPMNNSVGSLSLTGGPGTVAAPRWISNTRLRADVAGLASDTGYTITLDGFEDSAGNALDAAGSLGGDGALDFATRADDEAPRVVDSNPAEGQVNVRVRSTPELVVLFDEAMDTGITGATLDAAGETFALTGTWNTAGTEIRFPVGGRLVDDRAHALDLSGFADLAGNALDAAAYLGDGALDFRTGADSAAPRVLFSSPLEGATDATFQQTEILIIFDKAMNTSVATLSVDDGIAPFDAAVTWNLSGTRASLAVDGLLYSGRSYRVELTGLADMAGTSIDVTDVYLVDGELDFALSAPAGESCQDALTVTQATSSVDGVHVFELAERAFALNDGSMSCDQNGIEADGVIRYTKTTPDTAGGGTVLRIRADSNQLNRSNGLDVEVYAGDCDPSGPAAATSRLTCLWSNRVWESYLDVGPGDYYIWVARNSGQFDGATVTIEEVSLPPEGETCLNPFTTSSAIYTAPSGPGEPHRWSIPDDLLPPGSSLASGMNQTVSCDDDGSQGADSVIRFNKASATSVLRLTVDSTYSSTPYSFELLDACDPAGPGTNSYVCLAEQPTNADPELFVEGPAGDYYAWFAAGDVERIYPNNTFTVSEFEPMEGSSCARARPLTVTGATTIPVSPDVMQRLDPPSCGGIAAQYTWYRFTTTEGATLLTTDAAANLAVVDRASGRELSCDTAGTGAMTTATFLPAGSDVCVGIQSGSSVTQLGIEPVAYDGVMGIPTELNIDRPAGITITATNWLAVTPSTIYGGVSSNGILSAPRTGGAEASFDTTPTSAQLGNTGATVGEALFTLDDGSGSTAQQRLHRMVDPLGAAIPANWDTGTTWPADGFDAMAYDGTSLIVVNDWASSVPTRFWAFDPSIQGSPTDLGVNPTLQNVVAMAADATYFYVLGREGGTSGVEGIYRVSRADPSIHERIATLNASASRGAVVLDHPSSPAHLYTRDDDGHIHVVVDPAGASPRHLGIMSRLGDTSDDGSMAWDPVVGGLIVFETEEVTTGRFVRLD